ncbi:ATP-binding protein [Streptomyces sp. 4N509B]|uniref:ATP-binding protein n=1 Tax=Streptomyces sp. 4N509B TaxID=3457413 RepID=UPI003FD28C95
MPQQRPHPGPPGTRAVPPEVDPTAPPMVRWLHTPRPDARPGVWRPGHVPKPPEDPDRLSDRELHGGALLALLTGWLVWSLCENDVLVFAWWDEPLWWIGRDTLRLQSWASPTVVETVFYAYCVAVSALLAVLVGRTGNWPRLWRRWRPSVLRLLCGRAEFEPMTSRATRRALLALVAAALAWGLSFSGVWMFWLEPLFGVVEDTWEEDPLAYRVAYNVYYLVYTAVLAVVFGLLGGWHAVWRHYPPRWRADAPRSEAERAARARLTDFTELRAAGAGSTADRLAAEVRAGTMSDLDYARIDHAWQAVRGRPTALPDFVAAVAEYGPAAFPHPSGARDLAVRTAEHDLLTRQVRVGHALDEDRNPHAYRGEPVALDPAVLGTSLLAVGPPGSGKTGRIIRPVTEAMCLQALAGQATVVAVGTARSALGPDDAFDVILRVGDPEAAYQLDPYGGATDTDEAAGLLAEALVGGEERVAPRDAAAVLVQLIGPYHAAYQRLPGVPELRAMLDGAPALLRTLREDLRHAGAHDQERELDARAREAQRPDDLGPRLAGLLGMLDRAGFSSQQAARPFSLDAALSHPMRVRIDLPAAGHTAAGRVVTRLLLAQFAAAAVARPDASRFACLVLDDATAALTPGTVRGLTQLRPVNAGAVLALRTLDDVPAGLRAGLLGAVGCRMAFSGLTTWDAEHFARAWGTEWREDTETTRTPDRTGGTTRRLVRGVRKLFTGRETTTEAVTVRRVERERWSASELAHRVPPRHAVLSLTTVSGEPGPPVLVRLG